MDGDRTKHAPDVSDGWQFKPGDTIDSHGVLQSQQPSSVASTAGTVPKANVVTSVDSSKLNLLSPLDDTGSEKVNVSWSASEFIDHRKSFGWYTFLVLAAVVVSTLVYLLTRDKFYTAAVIISTIFLGIAASQKPHIINYKLDVSGLTIGTKRYSYAQLRSFAVVDEGAFSSIVFLLHKRFAMPITIYYEPKDEKPIISILSDRLPLETHHLDLVEQFMRKIRF